MGRCIHGVRVDDSADPLCQQCEALSDADYRADDMIDKVSVPRHPTGALLAAGCAHGQYTSS